MTERKTATFSIEQKKPPQTNQNLRSQQQKIKNKKEESDHEMYNLLNEENKDNNKNNQNDKISNTKEIKVRNEKNS